MKHETDVAVLGGGAGGTAAARTLAEGGKRVVLIEEAGLGGVCLNCGCIPTKFWLAAAAPLGALRDQARFGVLGGEATLDFAALQKRKDRFITGSVSTLAKSLAGAGVTIIRGRGRVSGPGVVAVQGEQPMTVEARDIIVATGSRSASYPGLTPDGEAVLDSTGLLALEAVPASLLVVGAGAIGLEFADFFAALGSRVTVLEGLPTLAPTEDEDIGLEMAKSRKKAGITCLTGQKVVSLATANGEARLVLADGRELTAEKALVAVGRIPNTDGLGLELAGARVNPRGFVEADECLQAAPGLYAVGDCNGRTLLAHAAEHQAEWVARRLLGEPGLAYEPGPVPSCVYGQTEIMRVGLTAREALSRGGEVTVSKAPFTVNAIAQAHGATAGFAKAVWLHGTLVGMAAIGHGASHLVTAAQLLVKHGHTPESLHSFMFAHPTLDEILRSALTARRECVSPA